jgi:uncharacterized tellurite resistance protein B-like protein
MFRRLFGSDPSDPATPPAAPTVAPTDAETETVRRIVSTLESMPEEEARFLAGFAYILSRAAEADMQITDGETAEMERLVVSYGHLTEAQAIIVVEIAKAQARLHGGTEDFLVTREFTRSATLQQRLDLMRCCFLVGASDQSISAAESSVLSEIANELNLDDSQIAAIRGEFTDQFAAVQSMRANVEPR